MYNQVVGPGSVPILRDSHARQGGGEELPGARTTMRIFVLLLAAFVLVLGLFAAARRSLLDRLWSGSEFLLDKISTGFRFDGETIFAGLALGTFFAALMHAAR